MGSDAALKAIEKNGANLDDAQISVTLQRPAAPHVPEYYGNRPQQGRMAPANNGMGGRQASLLCGCIPQYVTYVILCW